MIDSCDDSQCNWFQFLKNWLMLLKRWTKVLFHCEFKCPFMIMVVFQINVETIYYSINDWDYWLFIWKNIQLISYFVQYQKIHSKWLKSSTFFEVFFRVIFFLKIGTWANICCQFFLSFFLLPKATPVYSCVF